MRKIRYVAAAGIVAVAAWVAMAVPAITATNAALAVTPFGFTLSTSGAGNTAALQAGVNHEGALLHVESVATGSNAVVNITGILNGSLMPSTAPVFTDPSGNANDSWGGGVYLLIQSNNGQFEFGFPGKSNIGAGCPGTSDAALCWGLPYGHAPSSYGGTYAGVQNWAALNGGVKSVQVVADASWPIEGHGAYTADITTLSWAGQALLPVNVANKLTAKDCGGPASARTWKVTSVAGANVTFGYWSLVLGKYVFDAQATVKAEQSVKIVVHRPRGTSLGLNYPNGLVSGKVFATFPATPVAC